MLLLTILVTMVLIAIISPDDVRRYAYAGLWLVVVYLIGSIVYQAM